MKCFVTRSVRHQEVQSGSRRYLDESRDLSGRDAFHRVPEFEINSRDGVESVPTVQGNSKEVSVGKRIPA
jgi:hypothetical protein